MTAHSEFPGLARHDLAVSDAARGFLLSTEIGWNQTESDWAYMLANGDGVGLTDGDGKLVASAMALPYGAFGWVCMVLVAPDWRRRGIATDLMNEVIERLEARGIVPGLDATPAGREVYRHLGFLDIYGLERLIAEEATLAAAPSRGIDIRPLSEADMDGVAEYDAVYFGGERAALLRHLRTRQPGRAFGAWRGGEICGYALARDGRTWTQIGPVIAANEAVARALLAAGASGGDGGRKLLIDAAAAKEGFTAWLKAGGFVYQRPYIRMIRGSDAPLDRPEGVFAPAGPELG